MTVLDPMCGSGTVLAAATERGHKAIGVDMDPLAVRMSSVATTQFDPQRSTTVLAQVLQDARKCRKTRPIWSDEETRRFAEFWFADPQRLQLSRLARTIEQMEPSPIRLLAEISLSRTIITKTSKASLAADTSHSRPHRVCTSSEYDVYAGFERAFTDLLSLLARRTIDGASEVHLGDCRTLDQITDASIDLVVTSPPYLNAIDYMRGHKLALIWLGYTVGELRTIRSTSIGADRALDGPALGFADQLVEKISQDQPFPDKLPTSVLERYAHDLLSFARQMRRVLKPGSTLVAVVGNSSIQGNFIRNDRITQLALEHYGFATSQTFERELPENRRYMPIKKTGSESTITRRMRTETVLALTNAATV